MVFTGYKGESHFTRCHHGTGYMALRYVWFQMQYGFGQQHGPRCLIKPRATTRPSVAIEVTDIN